MSWDRLKRTPFQRRERKPVRRVSVKQQQINRELRRLKKEMPDFCEICGKYVGSYGELSHRLPRSLESKYVTEPWNLQILCHDCHYRYDNDLEFRQRQKRIFNHLCEHDEQAARRYFRIYD